jgi:SAM-dependent methyltransferase
VLILGGEGYLGSSLADYLRTNSVPVRSVDVGLPAAPAPAKESGQNFQTLTEADLAEFTSIVLLAGHSSVAACDNSPAAAFANNVSAFVDLVHKLRGQQLIFASTISVYVDSGGRLSREDDPLPEPVSFYDFHKQTIERYAHLSVVVDPDLMFRHYLYVSGTTRTLREHFAHLARDAFQWVSPRPQRVLDIACNDGTLLEVFRQEGCTVRGVDPAGNLVAQAAAKGLDVVEGYWPQAQSEAGGPFDVITATNVLAHVADPRAFLAAALDALSSHGAVIVEVPFGRDLILHREWDTIYHEHLSYFLVGPVLRLAEAVGAAVTHARRVPIHGGSLRLALQHCGASAHCPEILALAESERHDGLWDMATYEAFARHVETICGELQDLVGSLTARGQRVIGYGASAKGNTLLNRCRLPLTYIVDDNPLKHGYLTPGQHIPIRPPEIVLEEEPGLHVLLLAWNFAREILRNWRAARPNRGDYAIHYVPKVLSHAIDADLPRLE